MSDTVLPGTRVLRAKFQILSVGTKALAATQKVAGETFLRVSPVCQCKAPGGKKGGTSELTFRQFLCILRSSFSGWAQGQVSEVSELFMGQWQSIPGTPRREENGSCFPSNSYHQLQTLSSRETIWVYHSVFALWCGPDSAENIVVSSFSSVQPIWCLVSAMLCNRPWKSNVRHDYRSQVP